MNLADTFGSFYLNYIASLSKPDEEVCGVILEFPDRIKVVQAANMAADITNSFKIDPDFYQTIAPLVKTVWHTHVGDHTPTHLSPDDIKQSKALKHPYLVYHHQFQEWDYYDPGYIHPYPLEERGNPKSLDYYLGWRFEYGRCDCYTLVRAYYKGMLGIDIPDFPRGQLDETLSQDWDMFNENFAIAGFRELGEGEAIQDNDVVIMNVVGGRSHHVAVIVEASANKALHVLGEGRFSEIFMYGGAWLQKTRKVVRYAD